MILKVKKVTSDSKIPSYAKEGDAGMDLFANETVQILPGQIARIKSGVCVEIPQGYVGLCWDKSGLSMNHGIKVLGGVIDSSYRGELVFGVINLGTEPYTFEKGHKVVQMLVQHVYCVDIKETDELSDTSRGIDGFGSTGK